MEKKENINQLNNEFLISSYKIIGLLGKGSFGVVKLGIHIPTNEKVAIKIISKKNKKHNILTNSEISILKSLNHQNIVKIYEVIETNDNFYIIFEYISGGELQKFILNQGRLNQTTIMNFFYQLVVGISYLHNNNIIHRDLKPENILLTKNEEIKIIDFGLAIKLDKKNQMLNSQCGSINYCSPEIIKGEEYNGKLADIWSIGIILYVMNCGNPPFIGKNNKEIQKNILNCKIEFPSNFPFIIKDLISKILVINPNKRINLKGIMQHSVYKHGQRIFMNDNIIYDNKTNCIKENILKQCESIAIKDMKQFEGNDDINKIALKKILKNKALRETNWSNFLSGYNSAENKKYKRDPYFFRSFTPTNIDVLTARNLNNNFKKFDDINIFDSSISPIKNKLKLNQQKRKMKNKHSISSKKTLSININSVIKESNYSILNNQKETDKKITIKVYRNVSDKNYKKITKDTDNNKNIIHSNEDNNKKISILEVTSSDNIKKNQNNKTQNSNDKKNSSQSSKFTIYLTKEKAKVPTKLFPFTINFSANSIKNKVNQSKLKPYIKRNKKRTSQDDYNTSQKSIIQKSSNENSSFNIARSLILAHKTLLTEPTQSPLKSAQKNSKVHIVRLNRINRYSDKKMLDGKIHNDENDYKKDRNNHFLSKTLSKHMKTINTYGFSNYINMNLNPPVKISVQLNELCNSEKKEKN